MATDLHERSHARSPAPLLAGVGLLAMAVVAATPASPYQPLLLPGSGPSGPLRAAADRIGLADLHGDLGLAVATLVALAAVGAFVYLLRDTFRGSVSVRAVVILVIAANLALLFVPLLFSRDVYSYALQGRIAGLDGGNPYVETSLDHADDPFAAVVGPKWADTPAVYGPAWIMLSSGLARGWRDPADLVSVYRVLAVVASLAVCAAIAWVVHGLWPGRLAFAIAAFGANPVVLFHTVASGHNDLLVALAVIVALGLVARDHEGWAVATLTMGTLVKASAALPLLLLLVWCVGRRPVGQRLQVFAARVGVAVALGLVFAAPYLRWRDPTLGMLELAGHQGWLAPSAGLMRILDDAPWGELGWIARVGFALVFLVAFVALARDVWRRASGIGPLALGAAWGWSLLLLTLLGPVLLPWYIVWVLPLVWLLPRLARSIAIGVGVALAVTLWSAEQLRFPEAFDVNVFVVHWIVAPAFLVLAILLLRDLRSRLRSGGPLEDDGSPPPPALADDPGEHQPVPAGAG
ncbi:MAG: hypothetical protein ACXWWX_03975 [Actinomycetota bacterium]